MYSLIDSHCHLDFEEFDSDRDRVIDNAAQNGITDIIIPGVKSSTWSRISELCDTHAHLHACYGLHPYLANEHRDEDLDLLLAWLVQHDCVAVGECGLDYRREQADKHSQMKYFEAQLGIAAELEKPVVIHSVYATEDVILTLKKYPGLRGMVHSYSGSYDQALALIDMGFYISIGGSITFDNARKIRATASEIPLASILLETDAPDQPDADHFNQRNEPAYLVNILECLTELRTESIEEIAEQTSINARSLFGL